jgi:hypothetical protein
LQAECLEGRQFVGGFRGDKKRRKEKHCDVFPSGLVFAIPVREQSLQTQVIIMFELLTTRHIKTVEKR